MNTQNIYFLRKDYDLHIFGRTLICITHALGEGLQGEEQEPRPGARPHNPHGSVQEHHHHHHHHYNYNIKFGVEPWTASQQSVVRYQCAFRYLTSGWLTWLSVTVTKFQLLH